MKTIIEMAREADVYCTTRQPTLDAMLERFAELVRADEREKIIAEFVKAGAVSEDGAIVVAIRARGNA